MMKMIKLSSDKRGASSVLIILMMVVRAVAVL